MPTEEKLMHKVHALMRKRGEKALKLAQETVLQEKFDFAPLNEAMKYFMEEVWFDFLHPALLSLASEAVGGKPEDTAQVGAAFVLLAGGADVHDDIIDQSATKGGKPTVYGKFGRDITILTGDALLFDGLYLLHEAVGSLSEEKRRHILVTVKQAFRGISSAEAKETSFREKTEITGEEYLNIIRMKIAVAEATTKVGAILGGGTAEEVALLSSFGRRFGILNTVRDEIIDMFEAEELENRKEKECLPLPILFTFKDTEKKAKILRLLNNQITEEILEEILNLVLDSEETNKLTQEMHAIMAEGIKQLNNIGKCKQELTLLLQSTQEDI
ncbi:MAG: polyprenyl synthetase family protein [Candidatus Bathyarchaeia archaeon]|jgi:geranylgeranyl pyrophosphate synthase